MFTFKCRFVAKIDWLLLALLSLLSVMSLVNLYSAGRQFFYKQAFFFVVGYLIIGGLLLVEGNNLRRWSYVLYFGCIGLLFLTLFWGVSAGGSQRWLDLNLFRLQPSELAKLFLIFALSRYFAERAQNAAMGFKELIPAVMITAVPFFLILLQPDLGTALMLLICLFSMIAIVRIKLRVLVTLGVSSTLAVPFAWQYVLHEYQKQRIKTWAMTLLGLDNNHLGSSYQILQSKITVGSGGWFGKGFLQGSQCHLHFLPECHTDFVFSVFAEEWGYVGCSVLLTCYFALLMRGLAIGRHSKSRFSLLLTYGIVQLLFWQMVMNLLMVLGFIPVVGMPLPLFSYGGSSLLTTFLALGSLINIHFYQRQSDIQRIK